MKQHLTKSYQEDGTRYQFDSQKFHSQVNRRKDIIRRIGKKATNAAITQELADKLYVSTEAIKNWMYGYNGPSELEQVKMLGEYFEIDYHQLLMKEGETMAFEAKGLLDIDNESQAQYTKKCIRQVYKATLDFINNVGYYYENLPRELPEREDVEAIVQIQQANAEMREHFNRIIEVMEYSMLDIPKATYEDLMEFFWTDLEDYIDALADPAIAEHVITREEDDYKDYAMQGLSELFDKGKYMDVLRSVFKDYMV